MPKKKSIPIVPAYWFRLAPGMSVDFWYKVAVKCQRDRVRKNDIAKVNKVIQGVINNGKYKSKPKYYFTWLEWRTWVKEIKDLLVARSPDSNIK